MYPWSEKREYFLLYNLFTWKLVAKRTALTLFLVVSDSNNLLLFGASSPMDSNIVFTPQLSATNATQPTPAPTSAAAASTSSQEKLKSLFGSASPAKAAPKKPSQPQFIRCAASVAAELNWTLQQLSRRNADAEVEQVPVHDIIL